MRWKAALGLAISIGVSVLVWRNHQSAWVESRLSVRDFVSGIAAVQPDLKLVVARVDLVKTMTGESAKSVLGVDLGTTRAALSVPARVHYAVDLAGERPVDFRWEKPHLVAEFPAPGVQAVEVLWQDKRAVVEPGWARLRERSGRALQEAMERGVYDAVKRDAAEERALAEVREKARPVLARFLEGYLTHAGVLRTKDGVEAVVIRFHGEDGLVRSTR